MKNILSVLLVSLLLTNSCKSPDDNISSKTTSTETKGWKSQFDATLPILGHRNWIIVADKAFPQQNAAGMEVINTNESLLPVLQYVLQQVNASAHVKPIIYQDKELVFITEEQAKGITPFSADLKKLFAAQLVQTILHDSVFTKLHEASKLFKVVVLKTNETIPYTSVFLQLDCAYWNGEKEKQLRINMNEKK